MANNRTLKKQIRYVCGDIAAECVIVKYFIDGADKDKIDDIVETVAQLQATALSRTNVSFDKTPGDFANKAEYRKARRQYFAKAYKALKEGFGAEIEKIVKEMNAAMPKKG